MLDVFWTSTVTTQMRSLGAAAAQRLLGDTIGLSDYEWQSPSLLPGWSRAHIATHLADNAIALGQAASAVAAGENDVVWPLPQAGEPIETGSRREGLDLQVALDTSIARLSRSFDSISPERWDTPVRTTLGPLPARVLVLVRLNELVLHHVDLGLGFGFGQISPQITEWLLPWNAARAGDHFGDRVIHLVSDEGFEATIGRGAAPAGDPQRLSPGQTSPGQTSAPPSPAGEKTAPKAAASVDEDSVPLEIRGSNRGLLGWLTGRLDSSAVLGAEGLQLPRPL
ncbi:MAG: maleylpyruvate isomerase family mycothiol-dependent enzyme [Propionibacteriaceae bacterium]|nr:maleylpyruvate isomerase family mycothiol-dependent enzyme [Propionibacteriaceae bacterium]